MRLMALTKSFFGWNALVLCTTINHLIYRTNPHNKLKRKLRIEGSNHHQTIFAELLLQLKIQNLLYLPLCRNSQKKKPFYHFVFLPNILLWNWDLCNGGYSKILATLWPLFGQLKIFNNSKAANNVKVKRPLKVKNMPTKAFLSNICFALSSVKDA